MTRKLSPTNPKDQGRKSWMLVLLSVLSRVRIIRYLLTCITHVSNTTTCSLLSCKKNETNIHKLSETPRDSS